MFPFFKTEGFVVSGFLGFGPGQLRCKLVNAAACRVCAFCRSIHSITIMDVHIVMTIITLVYKAS